MSGNSALLLTDRSALKLFSAYSENHNFYATYRYSDPMPPGTLMPFQEIPENTMPVNIYYNHSGFSAPPMIHNQRPSGNHSGVPLSPGMSSGGIPSPGPVMSPMVKLNLIFCLLISLT